MLVSFENDGLVTDPDTTFAVVNVSGADVSAGIAELTSAVEIVAPDGEVTVSPPITFQWTDTASEDGYEIEVVDEAGQVVRQSTPDTNETSIPYSGPQLASGALYQWRLTATSSGYPLSRSEDLRGAFRLLSASRAPSLRRRALRRHQRADGDVRGAVLRVPWLRGFELRAPSARGGASTLASRCRSFRAVLAPCRQPPNRDILGNPTNAPTQSSRFV